MIEFLAPTAGCSRRWTQTAIDELRLRIKAGDTLPQLAAQLDRNAEDVDRMLRRLRLSPRQTIL